MKRLTKWMVAAAALTVAAVGASAQVMQADVPFSFNGVTGRESPGTYQVTIDSNHLVHIRNLETRDTRLVVPSFLSDPKKEWRASALPKVVFECGPAGCEIVGLWAGGDAPALNFRHSKSHDDTKMAMIPLHVVAR